MVIQDPNAGNSRVAVPRCQRRFPVLPVIGVREKPIDGSVWLAKYDFLLVFYSDLRCRWNYCRTVSRSVIIIPTTTSPPESNLGRSPFPFDDHHPHLIHQSLDRPHSPSQTASGSNQPFCHITLSGQTDRHTHTHTHTHTHIQTDRRSRRQVYIISSLYWYRGVFV